MESATTLQVRQLRIGLHGFEVDLVRDVDFTLGCGEVLGLVGESGSGKTTLGLAMLNHTRPGIRILEGSIAIDGVDVLRLKGQALMRARHSLVRYIPQDPATALNPSLRVRAQLGEALGPGASDRTEALYDLLRSVRLPAEAHILQSFPHQLSGGQQQRVAIAMAIATAPRLLVLDEPTTGLDVTTQAHVLDTVRALCKSKAIAALYVSHDLAAVASIADKVAVMYSGRIVEFGPSLRLLARPRHPYTAALIDAVPDLGRDDPVRGIAGHAPAPGNRPGGCAFEPRCDRAQPDCRVAFLPRTDASGHSVLCLHPLDAVASKPAELQPRRREVDVARPDHVQVVDLVAHHGVKTVLHGISFSLPARSCLAIVGESGSGKTTTARTLAGLHKQATGMLHLGGRRVDLAAPSRDLDLRRKIQYVFQNPYSSLNPSQTIASSLAAALRQFERLSARLVGQRVMRALDQVALPAHMADRLPRELSGGQRQRAVIARALIAEPDLLVCDEVTSALDVSVQAVVVELLQELQRSQDLCIIFVTHNLALARNIAETTAVLQNGAIVESGPSRALMRSPKAAETIRLLQDAPRFHFAASEDA